MFNKEIVFIYRNDELIGEVKANVQPPDMIFINSNDVLINDNDVVKRKLRDGRIERYLVINNGFFTGGPFGEHYQMDVEKIKE